MHEWKTQLERDDRRGESASDDTADRLAKIAAPFVFRAGVADIYIHVQGRRGLAKEAYALRLGLDQDHPSSQGPQYESGEPRTAPDVDDRIFGGQMGDERCRFQQMPGNDSLTLVRAEEAQVHGVILQQIGQERQSADRLVRGLDAHLGKGPVERRFTCYHTV